MEELGIEMCGIICHNLTAGRIEINNSLIENAIRILALGRKNFSTGLFLLLLYRQDILGRTLTI